MNLNKAFVLGNLTRDPERRALPSGQAVCNFSIATNRFYTSADGQKQQDVEFHNIVTFGKLAETASQYLKKGSMVLIEGRIKTRNWQDAAGIKHYKTEVIAERLQLGPRTTPRTSEFDESAPVPSAPSPQPQKTTPQDDIPVIDETGQSVETPKPPIVEPPSETPENKPSESTPEPSIPEQNSDEINVKDIPF